MKTITPIITALASFFFLSICSNAQGMWTQKTNFLGAPRWETVCFSIGTKIYIGTGCLSTGVTNDFWEYNPITDVWIQKSGVPVGGRCVASGFSIGNYGYVCLGNDAQGNYLNDLWRYDPVNNVWTQMASFPINSRCEAVGFAIGNYGYIAGGYGASGYQNTFWRYDPTADSWTQKTSFPGIARTDAAAFEANGCGYFGTGWYNNNPQNDFWKYDPTSDSWVQVASFPGLARIFANAFSINNIGYVGAGQGSGPNVVYGDFFSYNPVADNWMPVTTLTGQGRSGAGSAAVGGKGYIVSGFSSPVYNSDLWEFTPDTAITTHVAASPSNLLSVSLFPNPASDELFITFSKAGNYTIEVKNMFGQVVQTHTASGALNLERGNLQSGTYFIVVTDKNGEVSVSPFVFK